ncbi:arsenate-mycothiol transferase ArsC [Rhizobium hidalgonense]|uniref:Low molecular weight phosphatase family protein n=1 Tax=Rhizobium hidalgonense TaxID=1538159 RepID=A0A2A6KAQ5_9HYPH|nr:low molecular weight phosphatase family protein [Rhizobium hidalgonense]EJC74294.1 protein-tyrosine-phosphatase [Rhizobium leguminosarum bv. trifolii WSM2012]MDR9777374.1 low molecular weight phosphatase family protein [Rhizobium hidalgonense]MDR9807502.1 low molecular weight phosphatase family protein [Rhizobium hidalgonense]MDR9812841.1 low molecular weight phosphatase family protein [Rhizobium hidalgonense]MDR9821692.1 low molecular weight phosphatase family protein [Rhizobium hidalgonen
MDLGADIKEGKRPGAILFMCGMNAIRSPMAEAIARSLLPANTYIRSAGVRAGERDPFVDVVLDEIGLSLGRRLPQTLEELEDDYFDLIITLSPPAHHAALELTRSSAVDVVYWPTMDPTVVSGTREQILESYREVRDHLSGLIESRLLKRNGIAAQSA